MNKKDYAIIALVVFIWGINFLFMKYAINDAPPLLVGALRFLMVLLPAIFFLKKPNVAWRLLALYGLSISFGQFSLMFLALSWDFPTGLAALIVQIQVFLTVLFAGIVWREPILANHLLGMFTATLGLVLIGVGHYQGSFSFWTMLPVIGAATSWACGNLIVKRIGKVDPLSLVIWGSVSAFVAFSFSYLLVYDTTEIANHFTGLTWQGWLSIAFLAYISNLIAYTGWGSLLARYPASKVTPFALAVPAIALLVGYVVLNERLLPWHWLGIVIVMIGLLIHVLGGNLRRK